VRHSCHTRFAQALRAGSAPLFAPSNASPLSSHWLSKREQRALGARRRVARGDDAGKDRVADKPVRPGVDHTVAFLFCDRSRPQRAEMYLVYGATGGVVDALRTRSGRIPLLKCSVSDPLPRRVCASRSCRGTATAAPGRMARAPPSLTGGKRRATLGSRAAAAVSPRAAPRPRARGGRRCAAGGRASGRARADRTGGRQHRRAGCPLRPGCRGARRVQWR
jgi:hypothetical protein